MESSSSSSSQEGMESSRQPTVVFSFQGAFGPPTLGHYTAMKLYAEKVLQDYPGHVIDMLFMPTALGGSKPHLKETQDSRIELLRQFCIKLQEEFAGTPGIDITFFPSNIEYELCRHGNNDTGTYRTVQQLRKIYPRSKLLLGMGLDNMLQMPYWKNVETYKTLGVEKIYVASRDLTPDEMAKTRKFHKGKRVDEREVQGEREYKSDRKRGSENEGDHSYKRPRENEAIVRFDLTVPAWGAQTILQTVKAFNCTERDEYNVLREAISNNESVPKDLINGLTADLTRELYDRMPDDNEVYEYFLDLPEFVMVGDGDEKIPGTSSSMMRYYICKYIKGDESAREKIRKLIWGNRDIDTFVDETIEDYRNPEKFTIIYPGGECPKDPKNKPYDESYEEIFGSFGGKKTYKKRGKKTYKKQGKKTYKKRGKYNKTRKGKRSKKRY